MRICLLTTSFPRNRDDYVSKVFLNYARIWNSKGHKTVVVAPTGKHSLTKERWDNTEIYRFRYFFPQKIQNVAFGGGVLPNLRNNLLAKIQFPFFIISFFFKALRKNNKCDVILANWALTGLIGCIVKKFNKKPVVTALRGSDIHFIPNKFFKKIVVWTLNKSDHIIALNKDIANRVISFGIPKEKISLIYRGLETDKFVPQSQKESRKKLKLKQKKPIILCISRYIPVKRIPVLIDTMDQIRKEFPESLLILLGEGYLKEELKERIKKKHLEKNILMVHPPDYYGLIPWMNACDISVVASTVEEFCLVIGESMSCGKPCIGNRYGILNGGCLLIERGDSKEFEKKIKLLLKDKDLRKRMGKKAREIAVNKLSIYKECDKYLKIFKDLKI